MGELVIIALALYFLLRLLFVARHPLHSDSWALTDLVAMLSGFGLVAWGSAAHAADGAEAIDPKLQLGVSVYEMLSPIVVVALGWVAKKIGDWLGAHTKNAAISGILTRMNDSVWTLVKDANQTLAREIREAKADGVITKEEAAVIKQHVMNGFLQLWGAKGLTEASKVLGLGDGALMQLVSSKIEAAVYDVKHPS